MRALLYYLDPTTFKVGNRSKQFAGMLKRRVECARLRFKDADARRAIGVGLGLPNLPEGMPLSRLEVLEAIIKAEREGKLAILAKTHPKLYQVLTLRFGLDNREKPHYRRLQEVTNMMSFNTRERSRQLEESALQELGIVDEDA